MVKSALGTRSGSGKRPYRDVGKMGQLEGSVPFAAIQSGDSDHARRTRSDVIRIRGRVTSADMLLNPRQHRDSRCDSAVGRSHLTDLSLRVTLAALEHGWLECRATRRSSPRAHRVVDAGSMLELASSAAVLARSRRARGGRIRRHWRNVRFDRTALWVGAEFVRLGSNVRIDAYCVIEAGQGGVEIGSYVQHLATGVTIGGSAGVEIGEFCGLSRHVAIYSSNDDYSGGAMTNPLVPLEYRHVTSGRVTIQKHAIVGTASVVLPSVTIGTAAAVGALSLVNKNIPAFAVVSGNPLRKIGTRDRSVLDREQEFLAQMASSRSR